MFDYKDYILANVLECNVDDIDTLDRMDFDKIEIQSILYEIENSTDEPDAKITYKDIVYFSIMRAFDIVNNLVIDKAHYIKEEHQEAFGDNTDTEFMDELDYLINRLDLKDEFIVTVEKGCVDVGFYSGSKFSSLLEEKFSKELEYFEQITGVGIL